MQQCVGGQVTITKNNGALIFPEDDFQLSISNYKLYAVALHAGTMTAGHYTAACLNPIDGKWVHSVIFTFRFVYRLFFVFYFSWYEFNDEVVRPIDIKSNVIKTKVCALFYGQTKKPSL